MRASHALRAGLLLVLATPRRAAQSAGVERRLSPDIPIGSNRCGRKHRTERYKQTRRFHISLRPFD